MRTPRTLRGLKGFTLVELLIVIVIIAVLAAIAIPKFSNSSARSRESALRSNLKLVRNAVDLFRADTGWWPNSLADLASTTAPSQVRNNAGTSVTFTNSSDYRGPYLQAAPTDPVSGAAFTYSVTAAAGATVRSSATGSASDGTNYSDW